MDTRQQKRRWRSSPGKRARVGLDFGHSPSPKKRKLDQLEVNPENVLKPEKRPFTIRSFYGKRDKNHFPHSPGRRKAAEKISERALSDNTDDSENDRHAEKTRNHVSKFDFHSSGSAESDTDTGTRSVLRQRNEKSTTAKKVPLQVKKVHVTPKTTQLPRKTLSASTGKLTDRNKQTTPHSSTPLSGGKKFFKTRSPAAADKLFGSVMVKKGFDVKFVSRRSLSKLTVESKKSSSKKKAATKHVQKVKAWEATPFMEEMPVKLDGTQVVSDENNESISYDTDAAEHSENESPEQVADNYEENKVKVDSGHETGNSSDLFSSSLGEYVKSSLNSSKSDNSTKLTVKEKLVSAEIGLMADTNKVVSDNDDDGSLSLISTNVSDGTESVGVSEDLFASGRTTPSEQTTMSSSERNTPVKDNQASPRSASSNSVPPTPDEGKKLFPIFTKKSSPQCSQINKLRQRTSPGGSKRSPGQPANSPLLKYTRSKDKLDQMMLDAGQVKRYGATQCEVCGMVYTQAEPADETTHYNFHTSVLNALKFPGWKKEHLVREFMETGDRVIMVTADDQKYATKKVEDINKIMGKELGFTEPTLTFKPSYKAFLYISEEKRVEGCCVCEPISQGYRVLPDQSQESQHHPGQRPWYCSDSPEKASIGISRIWVFSQARRKGIASKLLDCVRLWALYGIEVPIELLAFSDPTPDGKILATKYTGTSSFLVYKYQ
ncbi:N-acetyltransferase ESCO2-like isoform X2 [Mya arenaria]|nr:N-acetyltransferase ESCO2-like isoform X2 [Mya arenaria]XP_052777898.1 N-acetyltransferase ESCO2-like isoform X2 [Mya arenaria]